MYNDFINFVRETFNTNDFIPLHEPRFIGNEKKYLANTIDTTFVSSVGSYVDDFENMIAGFSGVSYAIATVNGTAALHVGLKLAGVVSEDEVITQSLTFVASCNAIQYCNAEPVFLDVDRKTLGLSAMSLKNFLSDYCEVRNDGFCWNKTTNRIVRACVPMHTFGFPVELDEISLICNEYNIALIEDAAEALGSLYKQKHVGKYGKFSALSFNGNKVITCGGGGMLLTDDEELAIRAKHITTTAKIPHQWDFVHDEVGYNYRLPNVNAALGVAQFESLPEFLEKKRKLAKHYQAWGNEKGLEFVKEPDDTRANYWLNSIVMQNKKQRDEFLETTNSNKVMTRPVWTPMHKLKMNQYFQTDGLENTEWFAERLVNVPSSVIL